VIVLPGFGAGELTMRPLRRYLQRHGFQAEDWGLGRNRAGLDIRHTLDDLGEGWRPRPLEPYRREGGVAYLVDRMIERVRSRAEQTGEQVSLVGWSLGGTIAREVARDAPDAVRQVITLGSPLAGGPKYTAAGRALRERGLDVDWIEEQVLLRERNPVTVPITAVVSPTDAIVSYSAAQDRYSANVEHVELDVAHLGMGLNRKVWKLVLERLASP
jgi:pimeloyl-ACP methyl ester carboxylesterase